MSLINEALKKARLEAAQRDAARRGVLVPKAAGYEPRRRGGRWIAAAVAAMFALGLAAAGGMWLAGRSGRAPAEAETIAEAPSRPVPPAPAAGGETGPAEGASAVPVEPAGSGPAAPAELRSDGPPAAEAAGTDLAPGVPPAPASTPTADPPQAAAALAPVARPAQPRRRPEPSDADAGYVREAPLPGGGTIRLDGIAWSETTPAAVLDGQIIGLGERIHGVRVARIERDRVVLEAGGAELVLRLR